MVNKAAILKVADAIEESSVADLGFNMCDYGVSSGCTERGNIHPKAKDPFDCKTVACIAGWTVAVHGGLKSFYQLLADRDEGLVSANIVLEKAMLILGISCLQAHDLFAAPSYQCDTLEEISMNEAVAVLRHLAETGEVDWNRGEVN